MQNCTLWSCGNNPGVLGIESYGSTTAVISFRDETDGHRRLDGSRHCWADRLRLRCHGSLGDMALGGQSDAWCVGGFSILSGMVGPPVEALYKGGLGH